MASPRRYHAAGVALHWLIALALAGMVMSGFVMTRETLLAPAAKFELYQIHKASGVLLLWAVIARLILRFFMRAPALPPKMAKVEKIAAKAGHLALYGWMLIIPLTGWALVSASPYGLPTMVFDLFAWPHIPGLEGNTFIHHWASNLHEFFAFSLIGLVVLHIGAVIKHAVIDKENLLPRMWFGKRG